MTRKRKLIGGSAWSIGGLALNQAMGLFVLAFLARHLDARDFGVVAVVVLVLDLTRDLMLAGLPDYLVRNAKWDNRLASSAFWFQLSLGAVLGALSVLIGLLLRSIGFVDIGAIIIALAPVYLIEALSSMAQASLRHRVRFAPIAVAGGAGAFVGAAVSVGVVLAEGGFWALVVGRLATSLATSLIMLVVSGWRPAMVPSFDGLRQAFGFSLNLAGGRLLGVLNVKASDLIVGFVGGPALLGAYQLASRPLNLVLQAVLGQIQTVALSVFSPLEGRDAVKLSALDVLTLTAFIVFPVATGLSAIAPEFVRLVFGGNWTYLALPMAILMLACIPATVNYLLSPVLVKLDRPGELLRFAATLTVIGVTLTAFASGWGLVAVAWAFLGRTLLGMLIAFAMFARHVGLHFAEGGRVILHPLAGAISVWLVVALVRNWLPPMPMTYKTFCLVASGVVAYAIVVGPMLIRNRQAIMTNFVARPG